PAGGRAPRPSGHPYASSRLFPDGSRTTGPAGVSSGSWPDSTTRWTAPSRGGVAREENVPRPTRPRPPLPPPPAALAPASRAREDDRRLPERRRSLRRRRAPGALPRVRADVVVVAARGEERRLRAVRRHQGH